MTCSMMKSIDLQVTSFQAISAARKRRQASETNAVAVFEAFAEVSADAVLEDVEGAVENEIKSAANEELESLDADSFNIIGAVVGTITTVPTVQLCPVCSTDCDSQRVEPCIGGTCPPWSSLEDTNGGCKINDSIFTILVVLALYRILI